ncbi:unnamed protein product [Mytilus edulis]|uniref:Paraneoplastic antigen Ma-like C-terminal domain-containing protein n=1 Tax=Mytilus edulis TaxID=6550 RepID=A0A8S3QIL9_MYTED|nr:unnamed protein product [Mytilus edulis]
MFQDSQDSNANGIGELGSQQDLFDDLVAARYHSLTYQMVTFVVKVKELKDLKKCVNTTAAAKPGRSFTCIEKTDMERPLTDYLKSRFPKNPFLADPDTELKAKLMSLKRRLAPEADYQEVLRAGVRFSTRKMVDFRSQTKNKMLSRNESADLGCKSLKDLGKALFPGFNAKMKKLYEKKQLKKQSGEPLEDFWTAFKGFLGDILDNQDQDKWAQLKDREIKRIERYIKTEYFIKTQSAQFEHLLSIMASNKSAEEGELVENVSKVDIDKMIKFLHTHTDYKVIASHEQRHSTPKSVRGSLKGKARSLLLSLSEHASPQQILDKLEGVYGNVYTSEALLEKFYKETQQQNQTVADFGMTLESIIQPAVEKGDITFETKNEMLRSKFWSGIRDPLLKNSSRYKFDTVKDFDQLRKEIRAIELELLNSEKPTSIVQHQPISSDSVKLDDILKKIDRMGKRLDTLEKKTPEEAPRTTGNNQFNTGYSRGNRRGNNSRRYGRGNRYQNDRGGNRGTYQRESGHAMQYTEDNLNE